MKYIFYIIIILWISPFSFLTSVCAQDMDIKGAGMKKQFNGDVKLLSDEQLNSFWSNAKKLGYDLQTVTQLLQRGGFSYIESLNIVERIRKLEASTSGDPFSVLQNMPEDKMTAYEKKIYGLKLFYKSDFVFSDLNNLPAPDSYQLGVGDQIEIILYGETDANYKLTIDKEGKVRIPFLGPISIMGLSLGSAKSLIKQKLAKIHSGLNLPNATVFFEAILTNSKAITVNILGEVLKPGSYSIPSTYTIFNALYKAGGPTTKGTLRKIKVYRSNSLISEIDLYEFIRDGVLENTLTLRDQDVIVLETYKKRIEIIGGVRSPGIFEIVENEKVEDLIKFAGGVSAGSDSNSLVLSRLNGSPQFIKAIERNFSTNDLDDGDIITISKIEEYVLNRIEITGAVRKPGFYNFQPNMSLHDLIQAAGGLRSDAYVNRISVFQLVNNMTPILQAVNLKSNDPSKFLINERSTIHVPSFITMNEPTYISIEGAVNRPGSLPYYEGMTILDAIILAKGLKNNLANGVIELVRQGNSENVANYNYTNFEFTPDFAGLDEIQLSSYDGIFIRENRSSQSAKMISIEGEVKHPGRYIITPGVTKISDVITRAGGLIEAANLDGLKLFRLANATAETNDSIQYFRNKSIYQFLNDPQFEGSISKLQYDAISNSFFRMENERILEGELKDAKNNLRGLSNYSNTDSIKMFNNFMLSKKAVVDNKYVNLYEVGISYVKILRDSSSVNNITLLEGDILFVPPSSGLVEVQGNVFKPIQTIYEKNKSFISYIEAAGGFKRKSDKHKSYIVYPDGRTNKAKSFLFFTKYPKVSPDSKIFIPTKPPGAVFSIERIFSLITTTISTYLLFEAVTK